MGIKSWLVPAAAAGLVLAAGVAAAFQIMHRPAGVPKVEIPRTSVPRVAPEPAPAPTVLEPGASETTQPPVLAKQSAPGVIGSTKSDGMPRRVASADRSDSLREELRLLDQARQQEAHKEYGAALDTIAEHERTFGIGRLIEEREVIRVKALVGLGRTDVARKAAARFHRQFPRSVLSQTINEAVSPRR